MFATVLTAYVTERDEFQMTRGYQPTDSLFYIKKGSFVCKMGEKEVKVTPGSIVIFNSHTSMSRHVIEPIQFLYIKYSVKKAPLFQISSGVFENPNGRALEDLSEIERLGASQTPASLNLQTHYFNDLLLNILREEKGSSETTSTLTVPTSLDRPIKYMRENLARKISLDDISKNCGISVSSLEGKFRELTGVSPYNFLISLRMELAAELLSETTCSVTEIATRCGYDNLFYFCNAFKKQNGITPTQFRKQNLI